jgi:2-polyprenyl-3-methyl-5-hydroxy-6-metoxy-1,4-benzoquinol methylase
MLNDILALDKRLAIANQRLRSTFPDYRFVHEFIDSHLQAYATYYNLGVDKVIEHNNHFARVYARHLETFQENGLYPCEYHDQAVVDKRCYDIALILSCITNSARYEIVHNLAASIKKIDTQTICIIGAGAGIELALIKQFAPHTQITAYDLAIDEFVKKQFSKFTLKQENFLAADMTKPYDIIFAIELLEHVAHYERIIQKAWQCLKRKGQLICTTATDMPQFDHVYNFEDIELFKTEVFKTGFSIAEHRQFRQQHSFHGIEAKNDWFVLDK